MGPRCPENFTNLTTAQLVELAAYSTPLPLEPSEPKVGQSWLETVVETYMPLLLLLLVLLTGATTQAAPSAVAAAVAAAVDSSVLPLYLELIVRFAPDVIDVGSAAATATAADAAKAAAAASVAARGGNRHEQKRVATLAARSAAASVRIAAATAILTNTVQQLGFRVLKDAPLTTVLQGTVLTLGGSSSEDVQHLLQQLQTHSLVQKVWVSGPVKLIEHVEDNTVDKPSVATVATAAATVAAVAAPAVSGAAAVRFAQVTGLSRLYSKTPDVDGSGQLICILDTGINYQLPEFGSCSAIGVPSESCKVVVGYDLVGDQYEGLATTPPVEGPDPLDCFGHGTSVASVAATPNGVAPGALLGAYRLFGCRGFSSDGVVIRAIDRAVKDGCHIINLSCSDGSGYAERSPYLEVMKAASQLGVVVTKSAGNSGIEGNYFDADVSMAAGALSVGSVGAWSTAQAQGVDVSYFSSFGPHPALELAPHICAPGSVVPVVDHTGSSRRSSGTSLSSPYVAGVLALWRQHKQQQVTPLQEGSTNGSTINNTTASSSGSISAVGSTATLSSVTELTQYDVIRGLVHTAAGIKMSGNSLLEPVSRCGSGIIQADALIHHKLRMEPLMLQLPSHIQQLYTSQFTATWEGSRPPLMPNNMPSNITYNIVHQPAFSVDLRNGWYGTRYTRTRSTAVVNITVAPTQIVLQPGVKNSVTIKVRFRLPPQLRATPLLYSGLIQLVPVIPTFNATLNDASSTGLSVNTTWCGPNNVINVAWTDTVKGTTNSTIESGHSTIASGNSTSNNMTAAGNTSSDSTIDAGNSSSNNLTAAGDNTSNSTSTPIESNSTRPGHACNISSGNVTTDNQYDWTALRQWYSQLVPLVIPYQGYSRSFSSLPIMAQQDKSQDKSNRAAHLQYTKALCYAPNSSTYLQGVVMDQFRQLPQVCVGGFTSGDGSSSVLAVSLGVLRSSPACSLRITLAPQVPMSWLYVDVLDAKGRKVLGSIPAIDTSSKASRVAAFEAWSWCINFNGTYTDATTGNTTSLQTGRRYRLQAWAEGPVCAADRARGLKPRREQVLMKGAFQVLP